MALCRTLVATTQTVPERKQSRPALPLPPPLNAKIMEANVITKVPPTYWMATARASAPRLMRSDRNAVRCRNITNCWMATMKKKGQFIAPKDFAHQAKKAFDSGNLNVLATERGATFGYNNLVVDMRGFAQMREAGLVTCFDATHSVQLPSAGEGETAGERQFVGLLARSAAAAGIDAMFTEVHENPDKALCDGPCSLTFELFEETLRDVLAIRRALGHQK